MGGGLLSRPIYPQLSRTIRRQALPGTGVRIRPGWHLFAPRWCHPDHVDRWKHANVSKLPAQPGHQLSIIHKGNRCLEHVGFNLTWISICILWYCGSSCSTIWLWMQMFNLVPLQWGQPLPTAARLQHDIILGSDLTYDPSKIFAVYIEC